MIFLRSNTAVIIAVGPFYDKTDGVTIETALTITNERITLIAETDAGSAPTIILDNITGATAATANDLNYITGGDNGMMQMELAAADVNRVGRMKLSITDAANHVPVFHEFFVLPQAIYDWFTGVIVPLPANVTQLLGTAWLTPATAGTPDVNAKLIGGTAQSAGDLAAKLGTPSNLGSGATVAANLVDIEGQTDDIGAAGAGLTAIPNSAGVTTLLTSVGANTDASTDPSAATGTVFSKLRGTGDDLDTIEAQTDDIGVAGAGLTALASQASVNIIDDFLDTEIAAILAAVDTEVGAIKTVTDAIGATGTGLTGIPWNSAWDLEVESEVIDALIAQRLDELLNADSDIDGLAPPVVGSVIHELLTKTAGSFTYDQTTDSLEAVRDRGDAAWITATGFSTHSAADVWAVATRTLTSFGTLAADVWASATRLLTAGTNIVLAKGVGVTGFNDLSAAQVNAEVVDALNVDTYTEPGQEIPPATTTLARKIGYLFKAFRNKFTDDGATAKLFNDGGATVDQKSTVSDAVGTYTRGEFGSGP
jgi:hypothetical protein